MKLPCGVWTQLNPTTRMQERSAERRRSQRWRKRTACGKDLCIKVNMGPRVSLVIATLLFIQLGFRTGSTYANYQCCLMACAMTTEGKCNFPHQPSRMALSANFLGGGSSFSLEQVVALESELENLLISSGGLVHNFTEAEVNATVSEMNQIWEGELLQIQATYEDALQGIMNNCTNGTLPESTVPVGAATEETFIALAHSG